MIDNIAPWDFMTDDIIEIVEGMNFSDMMEVYKEYKDYENGTGEWSI